ncbi:MAG: NIPSNAP family protein [Chloroflexi bacterium]|nr:NIPSNAP family protein [Chloroflexota bacterium]
MYHELRVYEAVPGRLNSLHRVFADIIMPIWKRHGIKVLGFWTEEFGTSNQLVYMVEWRDLAEREQKWEAFRADPEWRAEQARSEKEGPNTIRIENRLLRTTPYSPLR